jgi:hypothetical protein
MRDSGLTSISPNLAKSTFGHGSRSRPPPRLRTAAAAGLARDHAGAHRALDEGGDVFLEDAALRTGGLDLAEIDAELAGEGAHRGAGVHLAAELDRRRAATEATGIEAGALAAGPPSASGAAAPAAQRPGPGAAAAAGAEATAAPHLRSRA